LCLLLCPAPSARAEPGVRRYLYTAAFGYRDYGSSGFRIYDIDNDHALVKELPWDPHYYTGMAAHAGTAALYHSQQTLCRYDLLTEELVWEKDSSEIGNGITDLDRRIAVSRDGRHILVPDHHSALETDSGARVHVVDAETVAEVTTIAMDSCEPHNAFVGRRYIYLSGVRGNPCTIVVVDPETYEVVRTIGPFADYIQHFSLHQDEQYVYVPRAYLYGIAIADVETGEVLGEWEVPPAEPGSPRALRQANKYRTEVSPIHQVPVHGVAARPFTKEVWHTDDRWGFLHVWDVSTIPPVHKAEIGVYSDINEKALQFTWVNFSIDGTYAYALDRAIDAETHRPVARLEGVNSACLEIDFVDGRPVRTGQQMGGGQANFVDGYDLYATPTVLVPHRESRRDPSRLQNALFTPSGRLVPGYDRRRMGAGAVVGDRGKVLVLPVPGTD
jgi:hypothetical protein